MRPFNPRLANKMYTLSNFGLQEKYISKFSGARSIQQDTLTAWANEMEVLQSVRSVESITCSTLARRKPQESLLTVLQSTDGCMTTLAQSLKQKMWGIPLEGITMPAQQEQTELYRWDEIPPVWAPHAILIIVDESVMLSGHNTRGAQTPISNEDASETCAHASHGGREPCQFIETTHEVAWMGQRK